MAFGPLLGLPHGVDGSIAPHRAGPTGGAVPELGEQQRGDAVVAERRVARPVRVEPEHGELSVRRPGAHDLFPRPVEDDVGEPPRRGQAGHPGVEGGVRAPVRQEAAQEPPRRAERASGEDVPGVRLHRDGDEARIRVHRVVQEDAVAIERLVEPSGRIAPRRRPTPAPISTRSAAVTRSSCSPRAAVGAADKVTTTSRALAARTRGDARARTATLRSAASPVRRSPRARATRTPRRSHLGRGEPARAPGRTSARRRRRLRRRSPRPPRPERRPPPGRVRRPRPSGSCPRTRGSNRTPTVPPAPTAPRGPNPRPRQRRARRTFSGETRGSPWVGRLCGNFPPDRSKKPRSRSRGPARTGSSSTTTSSSPAVDRASRRAPARRRRARAVMPARSSPAWRRWRPPADGAGARACGRS